MGKAIQNIIILLGIATVGFAGYYVYTQKDTLFPQLAKDDVDMQQVVKQANAFIAQGNQISKIQMDTSFLDDTHFRKLQSFRLPLPYIMSGRENPFLSPEIKTTRTQETLTENQ